MDPAVFVNRLSPWVFRVEIAGATLGLRWYGLAYVVGLLLGYLWFRSAARRGRIPHLTPTVVEELSLLLVAGVLFGARLGYVVQHPRALLADPLYAIRVWEGGMTFLGGLAGVLLVLWLTARRHGVAFLRLGDVAAVPAALGLCVGRVANFINGELVGKPTAVAWGVVFPTVDSLPRHPSQLYEAASHLALALGLLAVARLRPGWAQARGGRMSGLFLVAYGVLRCATDVFRADDTYIGPLSTGQWSSLAVAAAGAALLVGLRGRERAQGGQPDEQGQERGRP